jgi:hypothetical protein
MRYPEQFIRDHPCLARFGTRVTPVPSCFWGALRRALAGDSYFTSYDDEDPGTHLGAKSFLMRAKKEELKSKSALVRYI